MTTSRRERSVHPFAIAALVCTATFYLYVPTLLALVFGLYARSQIKRDPDRYSGAWMANVGIAAGMLCVLFTVAVMLAFVGSIVTCKGGTWPDGCQ